MNSVENNNFNDNLIQKIKEEKLVPKAKWRFLAKNSLAWFLGALSLLMGSISASLIYYISQHENAGAYRRAGGSLVQSLFLVLPWFWIMCLILFIASVYFYFKHTRRGYKYSNWQITLMIGVFIIFIGSMLSVSKLNAKMEDLMSSKAPYYDKVVNPGLNFWSQPEEGRLVGLVTEKISSNKYGLTDKSQDRWEVQMTKVNAPEIFPGTIIRLIGDKTGDHEFAATEILPSGPGRGFLKKVRREQHKCIDKDTCLKQFDKKNIQGIPGGRLLPDKQRWKY